MIEFELEHFKEVMNDAHTGHCARLPSVWCYLSITIMPISKSPRRKENRRGRYAAKAVSQLQLRLSVILLLSLLNKSNVACQQQLGVKTPCHERNGQGQEELRRSEGK